MKSFFKNIFSSCLGALLAISIIIFAIVIGFKSYTSSPTINQKGILHIPISGSLSDYNNSSFDLSTLNFNQGSLTLWELRNKINAAAEDEGIKGLFLEFENAQLSQQVVSELEDVVENFKKNGKKVIAYSSYYDQNAYLLSTLSDSIFLNPNGGVSLKGYAVFSPFFNKVLDKYHIDLNIYYAGKFKSSTEPYRLDSFSFENEFQLRAYIDLLYDQLLSKVSKNRGLTKKAVKQVAEAYKIYDAPFMLKNDVVDGLRYRDEVLDMLKEEFGTDSLVKFKDYNGSANGKNENIAIVFAQGEILWNESGTGGITHEAYEKIFAEIKENDQIKTVILRLNSPGGNGYASDLLHREIELLKAEGKKVIASLGGYATSGAYYIASACDSIFATKNTMTGSIGVYLMLPTLDRFLETYFDVFIDTIQSNPNAFAYSPIMGISEQQGERLKEQTDRLYEQFLRKVAEGRSMTKDEVHDLAQGRIWTGKAASENGLVDGISSLDALVKFYAKDQNIEVFPKRKADITQEILKNISSEYIKTENQTLFTLKSQLFEIQKYITEPKPNMRLPMSINVTNQ